MDVGGIVLGIEGEYNRSLADEYVEGESSEPTINGTVFSYKYIGDVDFGRELYAGLRAGVLVRPNVLVYAKGGYTNSKFSVAALDRKYTAQGYRIGGGAEYSLSERLFAKLEYRYTDYGETPVYYYYFSTGRGISPLDDFNLKRHQIIAGAGYRF